MLDTDLHIHTIHSGHAYGTLNEVVAEAERKDMEIIGISDHGPAMNGSAIEIHFLMGPRVPDFGIEVLWGCEANVLDEQGNTDLPDERLENLDFASVALHLGCGYEDLGKERNTEALLRAMENPKIRFVTHPAHQQLPVDVEKVVRGAVEKGVWLEINLSYLKKDNPERIANMVELGKSIGGTFIINSDAHFVQEVGHDRILEKVDLGLEDADVVNRRLDPDNIRDMMSRE